MAMFPKRANPIAAVLIACLGIAVAVPPAAASDPRILLEDSGKKLAIRSRTHADVIVCLWFYEWNLFDAVVPGQNTLNSKLFPWSVRSDGVEAVINPHGMTLTVTALPDGAALLLNARNDSEHDWPEHASIIPCLNPGTIRGPDANTRFMDPGRDRTYILDAGGLVPLRDQEFRCSHASLDQISALVGPEKATEPLKWTLSGDTVSDGLMIRDGVDGKWVAGIAWDSFLAVQGHNPWECLHPAVKLGPMKRGESRTIRGRIYLFEGTKEQLLEKYRTEFAR